MGTTNENDSRPQERIDPQPKEDKPEETSLEEEPAGIRPHPFEEVEGDERKARIDLVHRLYRAETLWNGGFHELWMRVADERTSREAKRRLAVARGLRALLVAYATDDKALFELGREARACLLKIKAERLKLVPSKRNEAPEGVLQGTMNNLEDLPTPASEGALRGTKATMINLEDLPVPKSRQEIQGKKAVPFMPIDDVCNDRGHHGGLSGGVPAVLDNLTSQLERKLKEGASSDRLARVIVEFACGDLGGLAYFLAACGVDIKSIDGKFDKVKQRIEHVLDRKSHSTDGDYESLAESLVSEVLRTLGLEKNAARDLFGFRKKQTKRQK